MKAASSGAVSDVHRWPGGVSNDCFPQFWRLEVWDWESAVGFGEASPGSQGTFSVSLSINAIKSGFLSLCPSELYFLGVISIYSHAGGWGLNMHFREHMSVHRNNP